MKAALVPVNTNYRYKHDELHYLWDNADAAAVVFDGEFTEAADALRATVPEGQAVAARRTRALRVSAMGGELRGSGSGGHRPNRSALGTLRRRSHLHLHRRHDRTPQGRDVAPARSVHGVQRHERPAGRRTPHIVRERVRALANPPVGLPAPPLMHGTGLRVRFDDAESRRHGRDAARAASSTPRACWTRSCAHGVTDMCIVGDAFCRPMVDVLDAAPGRYDLSKLKVVSSSGMMWSQEVKARLLAHAPQRDHDRLPQQQRGERHGPLDHVAPGRRDGREIRTRQERARDRRRRQADRARQREGRASRRARHRADGLLQGSRRRRRPRSR